MTQFKRPKMMDGPLSSWMAASKAWKPADNYRSITRTTYAEQHENYTTHHDLLGETPTASNARPMAMRVSGSKVSMAADC